MNNSFVIKQIGVVRADAEGFRLQLAPEYRPALAGLEGFSHVNVLWWFSGCEDDAARAVLRVDKPYTRGPEVLGVFATRSPARPNPIALSGAQVTGVDAGTGTVHLAYIDADDGSPVLDLKPYTPSLDRVEVPAPPAWCRHWPASVENGGDFDWAAEFNF